MGVKLIMGFTPKISAVNIFNPSDRFHIAYRSKIPLCGRKIRLPEDDF